MTSFSPSGGLAEQVLQQTLKHVTQLQETIFTEKALEALTREYDKKMQGLLLKQEQVLRLEFELRLRDKDEIIGRLLGQAGVFRGGRMAKTFKGEASYSQEEF
jgi:hypothetical protein